MGCIVVICIESITMTNGQNVPPVYIEDCIKTEVPFLSNVMLIGDKRKYLTCLLTLKVNAHFNTNRLVVVLLLYIRIVHYQS